MREATEVRMEQQLDLLWGADAIAAFIGRSPRQTFHALASGEIPAKKVCGRWCASRAALRAALIAEPASEDA
jgi:hypothetical protein